MSDYTIVHNPSEDNPWVVMKNDLVFDTFKDEGDAKQFITEMDECVAFCTDVQKLVEQYGDRLDLSHIKFVYMVEQYVSRTLRGLWSL